MNSDKETELKFLFDPTDWNVLQQSPLVAPSLASAKHYDLKTIYYDTPDGTLWKEGVALRVRELSGADGVERIQTVKCKLASDVERGEWEVRVPDSTPDLNLISNIPLKPLFSKPKFAEKLAPVFISRVKRIAFLVKEADTEIEVALDTGSIEAGSHFSPLHELELELKQGDPYAMFQLAHRFQAELPLTLSHISKAEHGHLLALDRWLLPSKSSAPELTKDMSSHEAFQVIARTCLHDYMLNLIALEGPDPVEAIHKGRVALRRLRAAFSLFAPILSDEAFPKLKDEVRWIAQRFGTVRDRDVLQMSVFEPASQQDVIPGARILAQLLDKERHAEHNALKNDLRSDRARAFLLDFTLWLEHGSWLSSAPKVTADEGGTLPTNVSFVPFVREVLQRRQNQILKRGASLVKLPPVSRHELRIAAKKLRYMADFFVNVPGVARERGSLQPMLDALEQMQAHLGELHDQDFKTAFLEAEWKKFAEYNAAIFAAGRLSAQDDSQEKTLLRKAVEAYSEFAKAKAF